MGESSKVVGGSEYLMKKHYSSPLKQSLALGGDNTTKITFVKDQQQEKPISKGQERIKQKKTCPTKGGINALVRQSCASLKKGRKEMHVVFETTPSVRRPSKKTYKNKENQKRYVQGRPYVTCFYCKKKGQKDE